MGTEGPTSGNDQQQKKIETGKDISYYQDIVSDIHEDDGGIMQEEQIASLLKTIDEATYIPDFDKRKLFDEARAEISSIPENARSHMLDLMDEMQTLESDNNNIPEGADIDQISEFINNEGLQDDFNYIMKILESIPGGSENVGQNMVLWREFKNVYKVLETKGVEKMIEFEKTMRDIDFSVDNLEGTAFGSNYLSNMSGVVQKVYGPEVSSLFTKTMNQSATYGGNINEIEGVEGIDLGRIDVAQALFDFGENINDTNRDTLVSDLQRLSQNDSFNQDAELEKIIGETNVLDADFYDAVAKNRVQSADIDGDAVWSFEKELGDIQFSKMVGKFLEMFPAVKAFIATFGKDFVEALEEGNIKKRESLLNLVRIGRVKGEGFKIDGTDFSKIKAEDLKEFFTSMDSYGIDYAKANFWEHLMTGEVKDGEKVEGVDAIHDILKGQNENVFTKQNDFSNNNKGFIKRLNTIKKKGEEETTSSGETVTTEEN